MILVLLPRAYTILSPDILRQQRDTETYQSDIFNKQSDIFWAFEEYQLWWDFI